MAYALRHSANLSGIAHGNVIFFYTMWKIAAKEPPSWKVHVSISIEKLFPMHIFELYMYVRRGGVFMQDVLRFYQKYTLLCSISMKWKLNIT